LLALTFARQPAEMRRLLQWLHAGYEVIGWGAWDGPLLAAQYAVLKVPLCIPGLDEPVYAGMSLNMSVHPDYRGRGLIKQVSRPVYETLSAAGGVMGMGFSNAQGVQVDRNSKGYGYHVLGRLFPTIALFPPHRSRRPLLEVTTVWPGISPRLTSRPFFHLAPLAHRIQHRFALHPFRQYHYAVWREGGQVCGLVVYRPASFCGLNGVTLLAAYSDDLPELLARWSATMRVHRMRFAHLLTTPVSSVRAAVAASAFTLRQSYTRSPCYLTVKPLHNSLPVDCLSLSSWDCMGGDIL
jgi:GNAT superfamily N-acetyltransferase